MFSRSLRRLFRSAKTSMSTSQPRPGFRPTLESLEGRLVPSAILQVGTGQHYQTITSALNAAKPGDTILVHPGTYQETVDITKNNITLAGVAQEGVTQPVVVEAPTDLSANGYSIVQVNGATGVTIANLTVEGTYTGGFTNVNGNLLGLHAGIYVSNGGSATIAHNTVTNIRDNTPNKTNDDGFGILVGSSPTVLNTTGSALVEYNTVTNYQSVGIDVAHSGSSATIRGNTVTGLGLTLGNQYFEQIGIRAETGGTAIITGNTVTNNLQSFGGSFPYGIELLGSGLGTSVTANMVSGNTDGIVMYSLQGAAISNNHFFHNTNDGLVLVGSAGVNVSLNKIFGNGGTGINLYGSINNVLTFNESDQNGFAGAYVDSGSTGNQFLFNTILDNGFVDALDYSTGLGTAGTANTWSLNTGKTDNHGGLLFT